MSVPALILAVPFVFYLVPFVAGYGWNAIGPYTPSSPHGQPVKRVGRHDGGGVRRTGRGGGAVPGPGCGPTCGKGNCRSGTRTPGWASRSRRRARARLLPARTRALLPTSWSNLVTFGMIGDSSVALYGLLRLSACRWAAAFGGAAWSLSGGLYAECRAQQLCRPVRDDPAALPAATGCAGHRSRTSVRHLRSRRRTARSRWPPPDRREHLPAAGRRSRPCWIQTPRWGTRPGASPPPSCSTGSARSWQRLTCAIVEAVRATHNKNVPFLAFLPMPWRTSARSSSRGTWTAVPELISGFYPKEAVDWNNWRLMAPPSADTNGAKALPRCREQRLVHLLPQGHGSSS